MADAEGRFNLTQAETWDVWIKGIGALVAILGAMVTIVKYFGESQQNRLQRERELEWTKAQFLFQLARDFEERHDAALRMLVVDANIPGRVDLPTILRTPQPPNLTLEQQQARYGIDRYMDFFDRMHSFIKMRTLDLSDIKCFEWYLSKITSTDELKRYALANGYADVVKLADDLEKVTPP